MLVYQRVPPIVFPYDDLSGPVGTGTCRVQGAASQGPQGAGEAGTHQTGRRLSGAADAWTVAGAKRGGSGGFQWIYPLVI